MEREPGELADLLVTRYPPGAGIGWHRDAPVRRCRGVSLLTACRMRFRRGRPRAWETAELTWSPAPRTFCPVRRTMAAPYPSGHAGAVVDDVPDPAARCGQLLVSRVYAEADDRARPREGTYRAPGVGRFDAPAVGPRAACRRAGKRSRDPCRGAVGRRRALSSGDRLGRDRTPQTGRDPARRRVPSTGCLTGSPLRRPDQTAHPRAMGPDATDQTSLLEDKRVVYCSRHLDRKKLK